MADAQEVEDSQDAQPEYKKTFCVKPHSATDHLQIELKLNDVVYVLEQDETGWWGGFKEGEDRTGWFPSSCVKPVPGAPAPGESGSQGAAAALQDLREEEHASAQDSASTGGTGAADEQFERRDGDKGGMMQAARPVLALEAGGPDRRCNRTVASPTRGRAGAQLAMHGETGTAWDEADIVASKQEQDMGNKSRTNGEAAAVEAVAAENALLKKENTALSSRVSDLQRQSEENLALVSRLNELQRQSEADRHAFSKLEATVEQERGQRLQLEQELRAEREAQGKLLAKEREHREQLERQLQAQRDEQRRLLAKERECREQLEHDLQAYRDDEALRAKAKASVIQDQLLPVERSPSQATTVQQAPKDPSNDHDCVRVLEYPSCPPSEDARQSRGHLPGPPSARERADSAGLPWNRSSPLPSPPATQDVRSLPRPLSATASSPAFTTTVSSPLFTAPTGPPQAGAAEPERPKDEEPVRGTVAERVTFFAANIQKSKVSRSASCNVLRDREGREQRSARGLERSLGQVFTMPQADAIGTGATRTAPRAAPPRLPSHLGY